MAVAHLDRRLLAILAADVVGYSGLMERDEAGTIARLKAVRTELAEPLIAEHHGRLIKLMGDGALVTFESVVDAVTCAVEIQQAVAQRNSGSPEPERIVFRIGVNLGDVALVDDDIYGDGVNIAARLEQACAPGGVIISGTAFDHLSGKCALPLEPAGELKVKNIQRPVRAYRVRIDGTMGRPGRPFRRSRRLAVPLAAALLLLAVAAGGGWWWETRASPRPQRPAIAVLPFNNYGGDAATGRLADGITEDIVTDLARFQNLDVIARNSTEAYKGRPVDVRQVGKELNVGYVLEGSIQRQADRIRVTAQLIDARSGAHLWADRWDRPATDVFAVQTDVAERAVAALGGDLTMGQITMAELQRAKRMRPRDLQAYDYFLLGEEAKSETSKESIPRGIDLLTKAVALDPSLARAYTIRAWLYCFSMMYGADAVAMLTSMVGDAERAVALDSQDAEAQATLAFARYLQGRFGEAEAGLRKALAASPANSHVLVLAASGFAALGKPDEGATLADRALRLDPRMTPANLVAVKDAYYMDRRYADTIAVVERIPEESRTRDDWLFLAASYAQLGREREAAAAKAKLLAAFPTVSAERMLNEDYVFARPEDEAFFVDTFKVLSLPVCLWPEEMARMPGAKPRPECAAERAKVVKS